MRNKKMPNMPAPAISTARKAAPRLRSATTRGGSNGLAARHCQAANKVSRAMPAARKP
jgi:hypothetical protein